MTVAKTLWGKARLPFEWVLALIREPALLALWVLVPIALAHACAVAELDFIKIESIVSSVISHIQKIVD